MNKLNWTNIILWLVYLGLLAVLLPHTAWAFDQYESPDMRRYANASIIAWIAAFTFEAAIAVLTHKLAKHIEAVPNYKSSLKRFNGRYLNAYALGLFVAVGVSALANLSHAIEYGRQTTITTNYAWLSGVYVMAFGAVLPFTSLLFARVLSNVADASTDHDTAEKERDKAHRKLATLTRKYEAVLSEREDLVAGRDNAMSQLATALKRLDSGVVSIDNIPSRLADYVTTVANGVTPNGDFSEAHGIGATSLERANSVLLKE